MSAIITNKLRIYNAQQFIESLNESASQWVGSTTYILGDIVFNNTNLYVCVIAGTSSSQENDAGPIHETSTSADGTVTWLYYNKSAYNNLYMGIGKYTAWGEEGDVPSGSGGGSESNPPTPVDTILDAFTTLNDLIAIKKIDPSNVTLAIPRINWEAGNVYTMYEHDAGEEIVPNNYVLTEDNNQYNVYKCINNKAYDTAENSIVDIASTVKPSGTNPSEIIYTGDGYRWKYMFSVLLDEALKFLTEDYFPVKHLVVDPNGGVPTLNNPGHLQWAVQIAATAGSIDHISVTNIGSGYEANNTGLVIAATNQTVTLNSDALASPVSSIYDNYGIHISAGTGVGQFRKITSYDDTYIATVDSPWTVQPDTTSQYRVGPYVEVISTSGSGCNAIGIVSGGYITSIEVLDIGTNYSNATVVISDANGGNAIAAEGKAIISPFGGHGSNPVEELGGYYGMIDMKLIYDESGLLPVIGEEAHFRQISVMVDPLEEGSGVSCSKEIYRASQHPEYTTYSSGNGGGPSPADERTIAGTGKLLYIENRQQISRAIDQIEDIKIVFEF